jgi:hypothetical protein
MNDLIEGMFLKQASHRTSIRQIDLQKLKIRVALQLSQTSMLQIDIVVFVQAIQTNNLGATLDKASGHMHSDEAGNTGD